MQTTKQCLIAVLWFISQETLVITSEKSWTILMLEGFERNIPRNSAAYQRGFHKEKIETFQKVFTFTIP
jgi:hypothetical protein